MMPTQHARGDLPLMLVWFLAAAGIAEAGTARYVDTRNTYNGNGLSGAPATSNGGVGAFNSVASATAATYASGDDVYFACNSVISNTFLIRSGKYFGGTAGDHAVIGAYYMSGGTPVIGVSGNRPLFRGNRLWDATGTGGIPAGVYDGMVGVEGSQTTPKAYVAMQDLEVTESNGHGLETLYGNRCAVRRCKVSWVGRSGISLAYNNMDVPGTTQGGDNLSVVEDCEVTRVGECSLSRPAAIVVATGRHTLVRSNYVHETAHSEGIGVYGIYAPFIVGWCTVEYNNVWDCAYVNYYPAGSQNNIWRFNRAAHTGNATFCPFSANGRSWGGGAFDICCEAAGDDQPNRVDNNWVYGNFWGPGTGGVAFSSQWSQGQDRTVGFKYVNNTQLGNYRELLFNDPWMFSDGASNEIRNNIFWHLDTMSTNFITGNVPASSNLVVDYNLWSELPADVDVRGAHDPAYALPLLMKTTGWRSVTLNSVSPGDYKLQTNSPAWNAGATLESPFNIDYFGGSRLSQLPWDIGAHEYPELAAPTLSAGQIWLSWAGSGRLEWSPTVKGPWTPCTPAPSSPYADPVAPSANRFYRLNGTP